MGGFLFYRSQDNPTMNIAPGTDLMSFCLSANDETDINTANVTALLQ
jgi:hypothetical protein